MASRASRRLLGALLVVLLVVGALLALIAVLSSRDRPTFATAAGPGQSFPDRGDQHLAPGAPDPAYATDPPTSGPHVLAPLSRDGASLSSNQLLTALEEGNVVLVYGDPGQAHALRALASAVAGPFDPAIAEAGQAVILDPRPRPAAGPIVAVAWRHWQRAASSSARALRAFVSYWLGRGASNRAFTGS